MQAPPFRRIGASGIDLSGNTSGNDARAPGHDHADDCCAPSKAQLKTLNRRTRLVELDSHLHCSVIGTCLTTHELRKLVPKFTTLDRQHASDLEIHHAAVELAIEGGAGGKALQKALDERYAGAVRRFDQAKDEDTLQALWNDALKSGDIPPAYWAVMTHPHATLGVRQSAFGELHMLSHLVGAANRADIRRLVVLEEENAALRAKVERQQGRLHEMSAQRDESVAHLSEQVARLTLQASRQSTASDADLHAEIATLRDALAARDERLALHTSRREAAEQRMAAEQTINHTLRGQLDDAFGVARAMQTELNAMERVLHDSADAGSADGQPSQPTPGALDGKRIVYVGGRPKSNALLKQMVERAGGELTVHDGGIEDRKGLLAAALPRADMVVFPVDCIDHDSMNTLKRVCERHQVAYFPVRTASIASFVELMMRVGTQRGNAAAVSRFCLRHG
ncbi:DUF2325 domain-containing protein [Paraburkholderia sp.]|uniref:DUF2325 domain-containing protein n=1 Tax=Paraburkholderia sp. TaxID=1926495 RepID=UPI0023883871|nr:DUF2325 domain-containing protein [Paraburkholderia sp.]MDE1181057.1 DUF2325 domain-containing protein [Paraburkholderia sp.]